VNRALACLLAWILALSVVRADWPSFRHDNRRSASTSESPGADLFLQWEARSRHRPSPAWPAPTEELPRMHSDNAFHAVLASGRAFFASSVTNELTCIDAVSGKVVWTFLTGGPVRNTPTVANDSVYVGSDDGWVYCLAAANGDLRWRYRPGPNERKVLGNGRMISRWPVRTNVLVDGGVAYVGAGVFPHEGIFICALQADNGALIWQNDRIGNRSHELKYGGMSPQGHLLASSDVLYVPSGRAIPAAFARKTGEFLFFMSTSGDPWSYNFGGNWASLDEGKIVVGVERRGVPAKIAYDRRRGKRIGDLYGWFPSIDMVLTRQTAFALSTGGVYAVDRTLVSEQDLAKANEAGSEMRVLGLKIRGLRKTLGRLKAGDDAKRGPLAEQIEVVSRRIGALESEERELRKRSAKWHLPLTDGKALILAGDLVFAGGDGQVVGMDAGSGKLVWQTKVTGRAVSLAATADHLLVSTDAGRVSCYGRKKIAQPVTIDPETSENPYADVAAGDLCRSAATAILEQTGVTKGWCLVLDCGTGQLAYELARNTDLQIVGLQPDPGKRAQARDRLGKAGYWGTRVVVEPWDISELPDFFANLVVSEGLLTTVGETLADEQISRVLRPGGGIAMLGHRAQGARAISWRKTVRDKLSNTGSWTHLYGNPQNTGSSRDQRVKGPMEVQWFGEPGPVGMVDRHFSGVPPLAMNGRLFVTGQKRLKAYDAYNGTLLWDKEIPFDGGADRLAGVHHYGTNVALSETALLIATDSLCFQIDQANGETIRQYDIPDSVKHYRRWGMITCAGNVLVGTAGWTPHSHTIFAYDLDTGELKWAQAGSGITHISLTVTDNAVFYLTGDADEQQRAQALAERKAMVAKGSYVEGAERDFPAAKMDVRMAVLRDLDSGEIVWRKPLDLTDCGPRLPNWRKGAGGAKWPYVGAAYADGLLAFYGHFGNHDAHVFDWSKPKQTERRVTVVAAADGKMVWSRPFHYLQKPILVGDKIVVLPRVCELRTGEIVMRDHPISGQRVPLEVIRPGHGCGTMSASAHNLFYRSDSIGISGLTEDSGLDLFGSIRPGCWLNILPADGLALIPEASSGCTCSYPLKCSLVLAPKSPTNGGNWVVFPTHGATTPVKHLALNLGAPGDMRDAHGTVWLAYPRPKTKGSAKGYYGGYGLKFEYKGNPAGGTDTFYRDFRGPEFAGIDRPWLLSSGIRGSLRWDIPLIDGAKGQKPALYTVRLGLTSAGAARSVTVKLRGATESQQKVAVSAASIKSPAIVEFTHVEVTDTLALEVGKSLPVGTTAPPAVHFLEVIRETDPPGGARR
jgi:outer membrane protein assembly factor BamB